MTGIEVAIDPVHPGARSPAPRTPGPPTRSDDSPRVLNRELSWLDFNARVLALAEDLVAAAPRAHQVPRDLQPEPRRVLRSAGLRPHGTARRRPPHHHRPTASTSSISSAPSGTAPSSSRLGKPRCSATKSCRHSRRRASASPTGKTSPPTTRPTSTRCSRSGSSRCSLRWRSIPRTRSRTSRTCH